MILTGLESISRGVTIRGKASPSHKGEGQDQINDLISQVRDNVDTIDEPQLKALFKVPAEGLDIV